MGETYDEHLQRNHKSSKGVPVEVLCLLVIRQRNHFILIDNWLLLHAPNQTVSLR